MANNEDEEIEEEQEEPKEEERIEEQEQVEEERIEEKEQVEEERVEEQEQVEEERIEEQEQVEEERIEEKEQVEEECVEEKEQVETVTDKTENTQVQAEYQQLNELQNLLKEKDNEIQEHIAKNIDLENRLSLLKNQIQQVGSQKSPPVPSPKPTEEPFNHIEPSPDISEIPTPSSECSAPPGKFICPKCNSSRVVEEKDKSKVLYMAAGGPIYAKKQRCLKCNTIWTA